MDCRERILSDNYRDVITDYPPVGVIGRDEDLCVVDINDTFHLVFINRTGLPPIMDTLYEYQSVPKLYGLMQLTGGGEAEQAGLSRIPAFDVNTLVSSGIVQVQRPPLSLTGQGVVIVCIDTGIDYTSPVFRDEEGNSRILAIWDQTIQDGLPPEGFLYGTEYTREEINRALRAEDPYSIVPSRDELGHGTSMAAVAAGSSLNGGYTFLGAAPEADIVAVKLKECKQMWRDYYLIPENVPAYQETDLMMAVKYADTFAAALRRPVVICLGIGTNLGDHAGSSALSQYLNDIAVSRRRAVVVCGGNEGNASHHYSAMIRMEQGGTGTYQDVEVRVGEDNIGFIMEFWGDIPNTFQITVRSPGGETIPPSKVGVDQTITYGFVYERTRITVGSILVEPSSGAQLIHFRVQNPTPGIWNFRVSALGQVENGIFHLWLPITEFLTSEAYFLEPNPYTTITEPAMADRVLAVSAYNDVNNSFYTESGRGFSRVLAVRPDWAAPGVGVSTPFGKQTGSSLAAAITAGGVAQFMQWAVVEDNSDLVESKEIKNYFIRGAVRSPDRYYPNREWGYGRLNVAGIFEVLAGL